MKAQKLPFDYIDPSLEYAIKNGDSLSTLKNYENGKFDLIITSPPYNVGKSYEVRTSIEKCLETQKEIIKEYGLKLRNRIIWHFGRGLHASHRFSGRI